MKRIECPIEAQETNYVSAYLAAPGLAVHRETHEGMLVKNSQCWRITHIVSGLSATPNRVILKTRREAARLARCLAENLDWTADVETLFIKVSFLTYINPAVKKFKAGHDPKEKLHETK